MATAPVFIGTPKTWVGQLTAANTNRDGTGTVVTIATAGAAPGSRIDSIEIVGVGSVTAGMVRLFLHDGTNYRLFREIAVSATVPSGTVEGWRAVFNFLEGLTLPNLWSLRASTHNAETFNVIARGGDYA